MAGDTSSAAILRHKKRVSRYFEWKGATLSMSLPNSHWLRRISDLLGLPNIGIARGPIEIHVHDDHSLRSFDTELTFDTKSDLLVWLTLTTFDVLADKAGALLIHAAALKFDDDVVLLSGPPTAGKSTLALAARKRGIQIMGDDLVSLCPETLRASPAPRPLRERTTVKQISEYTTDPLEVGMPLAGTLDGEPCFLHPRLSDGTISKTQAAKVVAIYFLQRSEGRDVQLGVPTQFQAAGLLFNHARIPRGKAGEMLSCIGQLLDSCRCATLSVGYGKVEEALTLIAGRQDFRCPQLSAD